MEETITRDASALNQQDEQSIFNWKYLLKIFLLNYKWFILSLIICLSCAVIYLRYATPTYRVSAKFLIKDKESNPRSSAQNAFLNTANLGIMTNSDGFDNEIEILKSQSLAKEAIKYLKLYTEYRTDGKIKDQLIYNTQPLCVDIDAFHLDELKAPIHITYKKAEGGVYNINIQYSSLDGDKKYEINKEVNKFPVLIRTQQGLITITTNGKYFTYFEEDYTIKATINNPKSTVKRYAGLMSIEPQSKTTTIAALSIIDTNIKRSKDYIVALTDAYNLQANDDKNQIAVRTEAFINERIKKIESELGSTDGDIASYKRSNNMVDVQANAQKNITSSTTYENQLVEAQTQMLLLNSIVDYMNQSRNKYQTLPSNVGLTDQAATSLINEYNTIVLDRNRLLRSASEKSPAVQALTSQLDDLSLSIRDAVTQNLKSQQIRLNSLSQQFSKYNGQVSQAPEQERILTQIGREQTVKSSLYVMLLQKREENSISLAATADKGKLIDEPAEGEKVHPKTSMILLVALILAILIPFLIFVLIELTRFRIEGRDDVAKLTKLPIISDIPVINDSAKQKADIVVHENQNNQAEEVFRSMRANISFLLKENEKVVMFTSSTSGEGKTFIAANLAASFAFLDKKVILVGLDIRRPRLASLFEINDNTHGITNILRLSEVTEADIDGQILQSGISKNLDLLMAGPIPPNPAELVSRPALAKTFEILRQKYDYIIVDTAPIGLVSDTLAIGRIADATIFACRADYTEKAALAIVNQLAEENKLPNINIIINGIDMSKKKYGYAYGYGKYGKYGKYGNYGYGTYGYGNYSNSHYSNQDDNSIKL